MKISRKGREGGKGRKGQRRALRSWRPLPEISRTVRRVRCSSAAQHLDSKEARFYFRSNPAPWCNAACLWWL
jgi:hypothetical protein